MTLFYIRHIKKMVDPISMIKPLGSQWWLESQGICLPKCMPKKSYVAQSPGTKKLNALPLVATTNSNDTSAMLTFKVWMTLRTTFDGRNPAPPRMMIISLFIGC